MQARIKGLQPPHCPLLTSAPLSTRNLTTLLAPEALASCSNRKDWPSSNGTSLSTSNRPLSMSEAMDAASSFAIAAETSSCSESFKGFTDEVIFHFAQSISRSRQVPLRADVHPQQLSGPRLMRKPLSSMVSVPSKPSS